MKKMIVSGLVMIGLVGSVGTVFPFSAGAQEQALQEIEAGVFQVPTEAFKVEGKREQEALPEKREELSQEQEAVVSSIEAYVDDYMKRQPQTRGLVGHVVDQALVSLAFDFGFKRDNALFELLIGAASTENPTQTEAEERCKAWFSGLTNVSERTQTVFDQPTGRNLLLHARYIDNGSAKTVLIHNGYRTPSDAMLLHAKLYSDLGYNVLLPDTRSHNKSEGAYITFGLYEKDDLNRWLDQELQQRPNQQLVVTGVSLGGATTMLSQETPHANVVAYIEDCGYSSSEQQFLDTLSLITQYFKYIPLIKAYDTPAKKAKLIHLLNETKTKPILGMDLYQAAPINSVDKSGLPKLFIHGSDDWFIPPTAMTLLHDKAIGYKEKLLVPGAQHGDSLLVNEALYTETVRSFLETVASLETKLAVVVPDVNLLKNSVFEFTASHFTDWQTSTDKKNFSNEPLPRNAKAEFVLKRSRTRDLVTAFTKDQGVRFYTEGYGHTGMVGQDLAVKAGETYSLSFEAKNETSAAVTYPNVLYGFDEQVRTDSLRSKNIQKKATTYTASVDEQVKVKLGATIGFKTLLSKNYTFTKLNAVKVVNADRTPPKALTFTSVDSSGDVCVVKGYGEAQSTVLVEDAEGTEIAKDTLDANGNFSLRFTKDTAKLVHVVSRDYKGNRSDSRVIVLP